MERAEEQVWLTDRAVTYSRQWASKRKSELGIDAEGLAHSHNRISYVHSNCGGRWRTYHSQRVEVTRGKS